MAKCWLPYNIFLIKKDESILFFITSWTFGNTYFHVNSNPYTIFFFHFQKLPKQSEENWWFLSQSNVETNHWPLCCLVPGVLVSFCKVHTQWSQNIYKKDYFATISSIHKIIWCHLILRFSNNKLIFAFEANRRIFPKLHFFSDSIKQ